jgi:hypothetical protein
MADCVRIASRSGGIHHASFKFYAILAGSHEGRKMPLLLRSIHSHFAKETHGFDSMAQAIQILMNEAMKIERSE